MVDARAGTPFGNESARPTGALIGWRGALLIVAFWTLYGVVTTAGLLFSPIRPSSAIPAILSAVIFLGAYTWAALTLPLLWLTRALNLEGGNRTFRIVGLGLAGLGIAALVSVTVSLVSWLVLQRFSGMQFEDGGGIWIMARFRFLGDVLACLLILSAGVARDYFLRYQDRQREASELRAQLVESRLQFLRAQLNPHFLSNTMNAVSALVSKDPKGVRRMVERLSELLRYTLQAPSEPEVTVHAEIAVLRKYLEVMEIRFQGRLQTSISAEPEVMDALLPNLILQPLAENAMEHGVSHAAGHGAIHIAAFRSGDELVLTVEDTGATWASDPVDPAEPRLGEGGYGLRHTRDRLEQMYGDDGYLTLSPSEQGGMKAEIRIPYRTREAGPLKEGHTRAEEPVVA